MRASWIVTLAFATLPVGPAYAAPTRAERAPVATRDASWATAIVEDSQAVVLGSALLDRFQSARESSAAAANRADRAIARSRGIADRGHRRGEHDAVVAAPAVLELAAGLPDFGAGFTGTVSPIPEPTSSFLFLAGVGLVALVARRKFTAPRRIRS
jgi:hypothetical protein